MKGGNTDEQHFRWWTGASDVRIQRLNKSTEFFGYVLQWEAAPAINPVDRVECWLQIKKDRGWESTESVLMFYDMPDTKHTISTGSGTGSILTHTLFAGTRQPVEDNAREQSGCGTYQTNFFDSHMRTYHLSRGSALVNWNQPLGIPGNLSTSTLIIHHRP